MAKKLNEVDTRVVGNMTLFKYKYLCPACTNEAAYTNIKHPFGSLTCPHCGKEIGFDETRLVELTENEIQLLEMNGTGKAVKLA